MELQVKCDSCGADLHYQPGTSQLVCQHCDHTMEFESSEVAEQAHQELDLEAYLDNYEGLSEQIERQTIACQSCGAQTELDESQTAGSCPFCDTPLVSGQSHNTSQVKPQGLLPFAIERKAARAAFKEWLGSLWFAPGDLKKQQTQHDRFKGIYLPFWTYDCDTFNRYTGRRGQHYYVTVNDRDGDGNSVQRQERRTRWRHVSGAISCNFDDILIPATRSLDRKRLDDLEPWDLAALVDYNDSYLSGYRAESYQIDLKEGYGQAKEIMDGAIDKAIRRDIGGDEQAVHSVNTTFSNATFKHILLPTWVSSYRYKDKGYQIVINARTGEVSGERPWSWMKIVSLALSVCTMVGAVIYYFAERSA